MKKQIIRRVTRMIIGRGSALGFAFLYLVLAVVGGTYAWATSSMTRINQFHGEARLKTRISETFVTPAHWKPGAEVVKEVRVYNDGTLNALARVTFEEICQTLNLVATSGTTPGGAVPELVDIGRYSDWSDASAVFHQVTGAPVGLAVKARAMDGGQYECAVYWDMGDGQYQRASAQFEVTEPSPGVRQLALSGIRYWQFTGNAKLEKAWGKVIQTSLSAPTPPPVAAIQNPQSDAGKKISFLYQNQTTNLTNPAAALGKWYYNPGDGYFYYIGTIAPFSLSNSLMGGLMLNKSAGPDYSGLRLELIVHLESIQCEKFALREQWQIDPASDLGKALESVCP